MATMLNTSAATDVTPNARVHGERMAVPDSSCRTRECVVRSRRDSLSTRSACPPRRSPTDCSVTRRLSRNSDWSLWTPVTAVVTASVNSSNRRISAPDITSADRLTVCLAEPTASFALPSIPRFPKHPAPLTSERPVARASAKASSLVSKGPSHPPSPGSFVRRSVWYPHVSSCICALSVGLSSFTTYPMELSYTWNYLLSK